MKTRTAVLSALITGCLALTACGGDDEQEAGAAPEGQKTAEEAQLAFARCMRENGVDMPDPEWSGNGGVVVRGPRAGVSREQLEKAEKACSKHREGIKPPKLSEADQRKFAEAALAHSRCMRAEGIDFPDPEISEDGGARIKIGPGRIDPNDPRFEAAEEKCREKAGLPKPNTPAPATP